MRPSGDRRGVQKARDPARAVGQRRSAALAGCSPRGAQPASQHPRQAVGETTGVGRALAIKDLRLVEQEIRGVVLEALLVLAEAGERHDKRVARVHLEDRLRCRSDHGAFGLFGQIRLLRELISNAAAAYEKLRYEAIAEPALLGEDCM
jgi:hypothetical protein